MIATETTARPYTGETFLLDGGEITLVQSVDIATYYAHTMQGAARLAARQLGGVVGRTGRMVRFEKDGRSYSLLFSQTPDDELA